MEPEGSARAPRVPDRHGTVRFETFTTLVRSRTGAEACASEQTLTAAALELLLPFFDERENPRQHKIRLIGVRAEKLSR